MVARDEEEKSLKERNFVEKDENYQSRWICQQLFEVLHNSNWIESNSSYHNSNLARSSRTPSQA